MTAIIITIITENIFSFHNVLNVNRLLIYFTDILYLLKGNEVTQEN